MSRGRNTLLLLVILNGLTILAFGLYLVGKSDSRSVQVDYLENEIRMLEGEVYRLRYQVETVNRNAIKRNEKNLALCKLKMDHLAETLKE